MPGVHTKWLEQNRPLVEPLFSAITGRDDSGLRRTAVRFRVRALDQLLVAGADDFSVELAGLQRLQVAPVRVLICENATTLGTLPRLASTMAVHGMGFAAPALAEVPWIRAAEVWYWGDLDTYGFQILGQLRAALPGVMSVLMDVATWQAHEGFAVAEPRPFRGEIGYLTSSELATLALVRGGDRRLEQERIPDRPLRRRWPGCRSPPLGVADSCGRPHESVSRGRLRRRPSGRGHGSARPAARRCATGRRRAGCRTPRSGRRAGSRPRSGAGIRRSRRARGWRLGCW